METVLLLMQLRGTLDLAFGAALGVVGAAAIAWLWSRYGHRINLALFFQATAIFLFVFVVQLSSRACTKCPSRASCRSATPSTRPPSRGARTARSVTRSPTAGRAAARVGVGQVVVLASGRCFSRRRVRPRRPSSTGPPATTAVARLRGPLTRPRPRSGYNSSARERLWPNLRPSPISPGSAISSSPRVSDKTSMTLDSAGIAGPSPVQTLGFALAGCMSMDVAYILTKGRHAVPRAARAPRR